MNYTLVEKIFSKASGGKAEAGDIVVADIDYAMAHDGTAPLAIEAFRKSGAEKVWNNRKIILVIDHTAPSSVESISTFHKMMREFATEQETKLYDVGSGICHQIMLEHGFVRPGYVIVGADSHTCTYGALGTFSTGIGSTDMTAVFLSGKLWFRVPETVKIVLSGKLPDAVEPKDVILFLVGEIKAGGVTYKCIEFTGPLVKNMHMDGRLTICNMVVEMGAKNVIIEPDERTFRFLGGKRIGEDYKSDEDAVYSSVINFDLSKLEPQVACPSMVDNVKPISEVDDVEIDQVVLGSCTNGRFSDLEIAVNILNGRKIAKNVRMLVIPASRGIYLKALTEGLIEKFLKAGCTICNPGCGPCAGSHQGILAPGEVCISTTNRNFIGRMGSTKADIYLASPATATASALTGRITDPRSVKKND